MPLALMVAGAAVLAAAPATIPATSPALRPVAVPAQDFTWQWTDGSKATERTFAKSKYHNPTAIPKFEVKVKPATPRWTARLLFWVNGEWVPRQTERSDARGRMRCTFLPNGPDGEWENVTWIVRIRMRPASTRQSPVTAPGVKVQDLLLTVHYVSR